VVEKSLGVDFGPLRKDARPNLDEIAAGIVTDVLQIAARENCSARKISTTIWSLCTMHKPSGRVSTGCWPFSKPLGKLPTDPSAA